MLENSEVVLEPQLQQPGENTETTPTEISLEDGPVRLSKGDWVRSRECACPPTNQEVCQIKSPQERGWETCPFIDNNGVARTSYRRWLWARYSSDPVFEDSSSDPSAVMAEEMTKKLLRDVSGS